MGECNRSAYNSPIGSIVRRPIFQPSAILLESRLQYLQARALYVNLFRKQPVLRFSLLNSGRFVRHASQCRTAKRLNHKFCCEHFSAVIYPWMTQNKKPMKVLLTSHPEQHHVTFHSIHSTRWRRRTGKLSFAGLCALLTRPITRSVVCRTLLSRFTV